MISNISTTSNFPNHSQITPPVKILTPQGFMPGIPSVFPKDFSSQTLPKLTPKNPVTADMIQNKPISSNHTILVVKKSVIIRKSGPTHQIGTKTQLSSSIK